MLHLDGSTGEGGGQVLRSALALSMVSGQPFRIDRIRAQRRRPGLMQQHLTAVRAAATVADARVTGDELGSSELSFAPGRVRAGDYRFDIGTAGSTTLVLQTVLPALLCAEDPSTVTLAGGTHNPLAPTFEFLERAFAPRLEAMGYGLELTLGRAGFYPKGGGQLRARIVPNAAPRPLHLLERGPALPPQARVLASQLPRHIGERQRAVLLAAFPDATVQIATCDAKGPGNALTVALPALHATEVASAIGAQGVPAERVADQVVRSAQQLLAADVPVGPHLADQLLLPLALAGEGTFRTVRPTLHTTTNARVIEQFLPVRFALEEDSDRPGSWLVPVRVEAT